MTETPPSPLGKAVTQAVRVLADLGGPWFAANIEDGSGCAAAWSRRRCLVVIATGAQADRIAGELERAGLAVPQLDSPEHLPA